MVSSYVDDRAKSRVVMQGPAWLLSKKHSSIE